LNHQVAGKFWLQSIGLGYGMDLRFLAFSFALTLGLANLGSAQLTPPAASALAKARLEDFTFLSGHNRGEMEEGIIDEHWSEVGGDSMMGMFRYIKDGKVQMYEFLTIEQTSDGPVLRLRHFNPGLIAWEEKGQVYSFPLISCQPGREAVFERPDQETRITYRSTSKDTLQSTVERKGRKTEVYDFVHSRE
jgi:Domain of unknown function (DUF6265)